MSSRTKLAVLVVIIVIAIAAVIALNPGTSDKNGSDTGHAFPDPIEEGDRDYPAASEAEESYAETIETLKSSLSDPSLSADEMAESMNAAATDLLKFRDWNTWVYLDYSKKPAEFSDTYKAWDELNNHLDDDLAVALKESLSGPCAKTVEEAMAICGVDPETYRNYGEMTQKEKDLNENVTELVAEYNALMAGEYEMEYGGSTWTLDSIVNDTTLSEDLKTELIGMLYEEQYSEAAEIYVELVRIRNDYAILKGYDNYSTYAYEIVFGRDYTPTEGRAFTTLIETAYRAYVDVSRASYDDDSMSSNRLAWMGDLEGDGFIDAATPFIDSVSDEYAKLLDYMTEYDLIDICDDAGRKGGAFTASLDIRGSAVIYIGEIGEGIPAQRTVEAIVHEFGHASNFCLNPNYSSCEDIIEIHSQGLEALYCTSGLVGEGSSRAMAAYIVQILLNNIIMSELLTELELWAYETEAETNSLTAEQVSDKFGSILDAHGIHFRTVFDEKYYWATVPHLFERPHYYISYGTSAIGAIELFVEASENYDAAKEKYLDLVFQQGIDGYTEAVKEAGLTNAFDTDAVEAILEECTSALQRVKA